MGKIEIAVKEAVDDYLAFCKEKGVDPDKPFKGSFNVRVKPAVHRMIVQKALENGVSLNKFIETTLEKAISEQP